MGVQQKTGWEKWKEGTWPDVSGWERSWIVVVSREVPLSLVVDVSPLKKDELLPWCFEGGGAVALGPAPLGFPLGAVEDGSGRPIVCLSA